MPRAEAIQHRIRGFTIMEVLVATLLIAMTMGSIMTMNVRSMTALRISREVAASSQLLQQRIEMIRDRTWTDVASSGALAELMNTATESEAELTDRNFIETMKVTVPATSANGPIESSRVFQVRRNKGRAVAEQIGDFSAERTLFFEGSISWRDPSGPHRRTLRSVICRGGLTRSGVVGSILGRPGTGS